MRRWLPLLIVLTLIVPTGCGTGARTESGRRDLEKDAAATTSMFKQIDPTMEEFFETATAYVVFPTITKGGAGIGGAGGWGVVYEDGEVIGYAQVGQATIGAQLGGQTYSQVIFLEHEDNLVRFKRGQLALAAQASVVAARAGAAAAADYQRGVAVFTATRGGAMFEASIGGQRFNFTPKED